MKSKTLTEVLERVETWPEWAQRELALLALLALEIEQGMHGEYHATSEELKAIDEGLADVRAGRFATEEEVEAVFAKFRHV